ncbi:MAG: carboxypeptidase regulatory-like domain-containing protein [Acidobacteria bacterium]|nr:carboxypeptidase regulatory-like domain-containing protein [Acidobacteriota bacterium]
MQKSFLGLILAAMLPLVGQQSTGTISGTITDAQDAVVVGAQVEVANLDTGAIFRTKSNEQGYYIAPGMAVGRYEVRSTMPGFKKYVRSGIVLQVNQNALVNIPLQVGQVVESVEVSAQAALVDTGSATLGQVVENRRVQELPLNGRSAMALTMMTAGVVSNSGSTQSGFGDRGIGLSSISINGGPNSMNAQMLDGNNNTLVYIGEAGVPPAVDAVEEFKVQSGTMSAEFGFTAGGSVNLVTKSGTNQFHGAAYEFLRNDVLDARNTYAAKKLPLRYNQYGGSLGGPIIRNKTFGFFNWEQYLLRKSTPRISTVPTSGWRGGNFGDYRNASGVLIPIYDPATIRANPNGSGQVRDQFPNNIVPQNRFDPVAVKIMNFWPAPNSTPTNAFTQSNNFVDSAINRVDWTQIHAKVDHRFSDANSLFVRYTHAEHNPSGNSIFLDPTVGQDRVDDQTNRNAVVSDTHVFSPTLINNLRVGISRQSFIFQAVNAGQNWPSRLGFAPIVPNDQMPDINFGYGNIGGQANGTRASLSWDIQDMVTKIAGNHTLKAGFNLRMMQGGNKQGSGLSGVFRFGGLTQNPQSTAGTGADMAGFLLGTVSSVYIDSILGNMFEGNSYSFFVQDDWKLNRKLTLNLGIRYDYQPKAMERHNGIINFDQNGVDPKSGLKGTTVYAGVDGQPREWMGSDKNDFGPRFGFAYDVFGSGNTVVRGGYGIFYPQVAYRDFFGNTQLFSTTTTSYSSPGPGLPIVQLQAGFPYAPLKSPGSSAGPGALLGLGVSLTENDPTTPLTQQWNFSIQHQIKSWMVDATYAGNKGNHFIANTYNLNQVNPDTRYALKQSLNDAVPNPYAGKVPGGLGAATISREQSLRAYPYYSSVSVFNPRNGNYVSHQLQLNVRRNFASGFLVNFAYTKGKIISDSLNTPVNWNLEAGNDIGYQDGLYNRKLNKSIDPNDVAQRAVVSLVYELPFGAGQRFNPSNAALRQMVGGWQISTIGQMQSGQPLRIRGASNQMADRPNSTGQSAKIDTPSAQRWFNTDVFINPVDFTFGNVGRTLPDVRAPGTFNWDLSAIKNTRITERVNLQFRVEAFNFLNSVNLGAPSTSFSPGAGGKNVSATFGTITSARDSRSIQLGMKLLF